MNFRGVTLAQLIELLKNNALGQFMHAVQFMLKAINAFSQFIRKALYDSTLHDGMVFPDV